MTPERAEELLEKAEARLAKALKMQQRGRQAEDRARRAIEWAQARLTAGPMVELDIDGEDGPADFTDDEEAIEAICAHAERGRNGGRL